MGNKFRRLFWDKPGACIATRNDQLASQDTIHPKDNRVLSIRELMRLMTIPDDFKWSDIDINSLSSLKDKTNFLKANELNIRRCIGEAVPTLIMQTIAKNANEMLDFQEHVENYYSKKTDTKSNSSFYVKAFEYEISLLDAKGTGSYYTPQTVVFEALSTLDFSNYNTINILEPSVGMGAFIPQLLRLCDVCNSATIDVCDCDNNALALLKENLKEIGYNSQKTKINYIFGDFITISNIKDKYDVIVSNPPFTKASSQLLLEYKTKWDVGKSTNVFSFFLDKFLTLADEIVVILPKSFIMSVEYNEIRKKYEEYGIKHIVDFGTKYFKKVFVEILSFHFIKKYRGRTQIENKLFGEKLEQPFGYIYHDKSWLIYRNEWFDNYIANLELDVFYSIRDRQITNKNVSTSGDIWVLRSKNVLDDGTIVSKAGYDRFINSKDLSKYAIGRYINTNAIIMPSFTYLTRASYLPDNCIPNGSIAILIPKKFTYNLDLSLYSSQDFRRYYEIVKNKAKFTLNIDANSVYYMINFLKMQSL